MGAQQVEWSCDKVVTHLIKLSATSSLPPHLSSAPSLFLWINWGTLIFIYSTYCSFHRFMSRLYLSLLVEWHGCHPIKPTQFICTLPRRCVMEFFCYTKAWRPMGMWRMSDVLVSSLYRHDKLWFQRVSSMPHKLISVCVCVCVYVCVCVCLLPVRDLYVTSFLLLRTKCSKDTLMHKGILMKEL